MAVFMTPPAIHAPAPVQRQQIPIVNIDSENKAGWILVYRSQGFDLIKGGLTQAQCERARHIISSNGECVAPE